MEASKVLPFYHNFTKEESLFQNESSLETETLSLLPLNYAYVICEVVVALVAVVGNALTVTVFAIERKLRRMTNYYIVSLAVADLLIGIFGVPFAILTYVGFPRHLMSCLLMLSMLVVLCTVSIFSLLAVSIDRYWAILHPMIYARVMTSSLVRKIIVVCWVAGTLIGVLPLFGWHHKGRGLCEFREVMDYKYLVFLYFFTIVGPGLLMAVFYAHIYSVILKQLRQIATQEKSNDSDSLRVERTAGDVLRDAASKAVRKILKRSKKSRGNFSSVNISLSDNKIDDNFSRLVSEAYDVDQDIDRSGSPSPSHKEPPRDGTESPSSREVVIDETKRQKRSSLGRKLHESLKNNGTGAGMGSLLSQALTRPSRREIKAAKNLSIIVLFFLICWFPLYTINCVQAFCPGPECQPPIEFLNFTIILSHANSAVNPILYAYHMKDFRRALKAFIFEKIFRRSVSSTTLFNKSLVSPHHSTIHRVSGQGMSVGLHSPHNRTDNISPIISSRSRSPTYFSKKKFDPIKDQEYIRHENNDRIDTPRKKSLSISNIYGFCNSLQKEAPLVKDMNRTSSLSVQNTYKPKIKPPSITCAPLASMDTIYTEDSFKKVSSKPNNDISFIDDIPSSEYYYVLQKDMYIDENIGEPIKQNSSKRISVDQLTDCSFELPLDVKNTSNESLLFRTKANIEFKDIKIDTYFDQTRLNIKPKSQSELKTSQSIDIIENNLQIEENNRLFILSTSNSSKKEELYEDSVQTKHNSAISSNSSHSLKSTSCSQSLKRVNSDEGTVR